MGKFGDSDENRTSRRVMETKTGGEREVGNEEGRRGEGGEEVAFGFL